ncbi:hypothetical protein Sjap_012927 [Stephania japonica]|uniref:Uncharacterized protein n=1 Tax=Stephania japonica TaxID=461633 RepID=A0AAP0NZE5_9MAGN
MEDHQTLVEPEPEISLRVAGLRGRIEGQRPQAGSRDGELEGLLRREKNWEVLDACLNADDMKLVAGAYGFLQSRGFYFLPNFGKCRNIDEFLSFGCDLVELDD